MRLAVVVPLGPQETLESVEALLSGIKSLGVAHQVILSGIEGSGILKSLRSYQSGKFEFGVVESEAPHRARQINRGIDSAKGDWFWVLHVDSDLSGIDHRTINEVCGDRKRGFALYHFQLAFKSDGPPQTFLNAKLANIRSRYLKLPFGDQGFLFSRLVYERLGPFDEAAAFGEDHLYVWRAHQLRIPVIELPGIIRTSARKYKLRGWGATTRKHVYLSFKQGTPEFFEMLRAWSKERAERNQSK